MGHNSIVRVGNDEVVVGTNLKMFEVVSANRVNRLKQILQRLHYEAEVLTLYCMLTSSQTQNCYNC